MYNPPNTNIYGIKLQYLIQEHMLLCGVRSAESLLVIRPEPLYVRDVYKGTLYIPLVRGACKSFIRHLVEGDLQPLPKRTCILYRVDTVY